MLWVKNYASKLFKKLVLELRGKFSVVGTFGRMPDM